MKIEKLLQYIDILLYISKNDKIELRIIADKFNISYQTIHSLIEKWKNEGYIERKRKDILILGGDKYEYSLTEKCRKLILDLKKKFE